MSIHRVSVAAPAAYPSDPNITFPFEPKQIQFDLNEIAAGKSVTFSFDGVTDHIVLEYNTAANRAYLSRQRQTRVWVKGTNNALCSATAEQF